MPPKGLGTALHDGSGRLMFVQGYGVALGVCGIGVTKDALQGCLHAVSIAVYAYSYTLSYPLASTSTQRLSVLYLFPREAGLFNVANHRQAKVAVGLCKIERSEIHKPNDAFECPSEFALLCVFFHILLKITDTLRNFICVLGLHSYSRNCEYNPILIYHQ